MHPITTAIASATVFVLSTSLEPVDGHPAFAREEIELALDLSEGAPALAQPLSWRDAFDTWNVLGEHNPDGSREGPSRRERIRGMV